MDAVDENVEQTDDTEDVRALREPDLDRRPGEETAIPSSVTAVQTMLRPTFSYKPAEQLQGSSPCAPIISGTYGISRRAEKTSCPQYVRINAAGERLIGCVQLVIGELLPELAMVRDLVEVAG